MRTSEKVNVRVVVRKRPVPASERDCVEVRAPSVQVVEPKVKADLTKYKHTHTFDFDDSFSELEDTQEIFDSSVHDLVTNAFDGGTSTCFCFGQTASGKTFTLFGRGGGLEGHTSDPGKFKGPCSDSQKIDRLNLLIKF